MESALGLSVPEWKHILDGWNERSFYGGVIFSWLHDKRVTSFEEMTNLPGKLREKLAGQYQIDTAQVRTVQTSSDGTRKYLLGLSDSKAIECVLMKYRFGYSLCISSQAGCRMGCRFCASTLNGLDRNLTRAEMLLQVYTVEKEAHVKVSHVVVMGCGEPFDNYEEVIGFLKLIHDEKGKGLSYRNLTVSTCGLTEKIKAFADLDLPVTLAISLHAPNDETRRKIMRIAQAVSMDELMEACRYYTGKTNRRITFEYLLIDHVNDSEQQALELCGLLGRLLCHVNIIPVNPVPECGFLRPSEDRIRQFIQVLEGHHIPVSRRREMGREIDAACGQLRLRETRH